MFFINPCSVREKPEQKVYSTLGRVQRSNPRAVVGVAAFLDVPLVFISARIWRSIHPAVFASEGGGLDPAILLTAMTCVAAFGLLWAGLVWTRKRQLDLSARLEALTVNRLHG